MTLAARGFAHRWAARGVWAGLGLCLASLLLLGPYLVGGTELVRLRNAWSLGPDLTAADDWRPPSVPAGYRTEIGPADPYFVAQAQRLGLAELPDDWARALAISAHLLGSAPRLLGNPIQSDLRSTHQKIIGEGLGYCGDFVRAFTALANAAGMTVRPWAFSFDGFGGHGHIWVEVWNRQRQAWQLVDIYQNYHFVLAEGVPLSALQTREALQQNDPGLKLLPLHAGSRPGWEEEHRARNYLKRGIDEWYALWGDNVMTVDRLSAWAHFDGPLGRSLQGLAVIASGQQPQVRILATPSNAERRQALRAVRARTMAGGVLGVVGIVLVAAGLAFRRAAAAPAPPGRGDWPRLCIVGPLPPPSGGMANQCEQLVRLLKEAGAQVELVRTNAPYRPAWVARWRGVRAVFRLLPYVLALWRAAGRADLVHVLANSGWAWHLLAAPAVWMARLRHKPVVVNYRGGQAQEFLSAAPRIVHRTLRTAGFIVTPSTFLQRVFAGFGLSTLIVPNIVDLSRFQRRALRPGAADPHLIVTRNLEAIYDVPTALQAFAIVKERFPRARLTVAGSGPELARLQERVRQLQLHDSVAFSGRIDNERIGALYASADLMLNPSTADNMPISILEALASGVPVVSTDAGGIPDLVTDGRTALLVPVGDAAAMARAAIRVLEQPELAQGLADEGAELAASFSWARVAPRWHAAYAACLAGRVPSGGDRPAVPRDARSPDAGPPQRMTPP